jgi:hypothetical protein
MRSSIGRDEIERRRPRACIAAQQPWTGETGPTGKGHLRLSPVGRKQPHSDALEAGVRCAAGARGPAYRWDSNEGGPVIVVRLIEHVKQQHWTGIIVELAIVILGVFIGLQVDNCNQARRDRARELAYLEGIAVELGESIDSIDDSVELTKERMALDELLIKAATEPGVVRDNTGRFIYAVTLGG